MITCHSRILDFVGQLSHSSISSINLDYLRKLLIFTYSFRYLKQNLSKIRRVSTGNFAENIDVSSTINSSALVVESIHPKDALSTNRKRLLNKKLDLDREMDNESKDDYSNVTQTRRYDENGEHFKKSKGAHENAEEIKVPCLMTVDQLRIDDYPVLNVVDKITNIDDIDDVLPSPPSFIEMSRSGYSPQVVNNSSSTALSVPLTSSSNNPEHSLKIIVEPEKSSRDDAGGTFQPISVDASEFITMAVDTICTVQDGSTFEFDCPENDCPKESASVATLALENNVMKDEQNTEYHLNDINNVLPEIKDFCCATNRPDFGTPKGEQALLSFAKQPSSIDQNSFTALCDYPLGMVRNEQIKQNMPLTNAFYFKTSLIDVKSVILGLVKDVLGLHQLLLRDGTG